MPGVTGCTAGRACRPFILWYDHFIPQGGWAMSRTVKFTVSVPGPVFKALEALRRKTGKSRSQLVRDAILGSGSKAGKRAAEDTRGRSGRQRGPGPIRSSGSLLPGDHGCRRAAPSGDRRGGPVQVRDATISPRNTTRASKRLTRPSPERSLHLRRDRGGSHDGLRRHELSPGRPRRRRHEPCPREDPLGEPAGRRDRPRDP